MITIEKIQERLSKNPRADQPISTSLVSGVHLRDVIQALLHEINAELAKKVGK